MKRLWNEIEELLAVECGGLFPWCKKRALEYCDMGDVNQAFASMVSDLGKDPSTEGHTGIQLGMEQLMGGMLSAPYQMRHFIKGFN